MSDTGQISQPTRIKELIARIAGGSALTLDRRARRSTS